MTLSYLLMPMFCVSALLLYGSGHGTKYIFDGVFAQSIVSMRF